MKKNFLIEIPFRLFVLSAVSPDTSNWWITFNSYSNLKQMKQENIKIILNLLEDESKFFGNFPKLVFFPHKMTKKKTEKMICNFEICF